LIDELWRGFNDADRKLRLLHTFKGCGEGAHVCDFSRHQELQCLFRALVLREADF
jgi:hypothetical protein